MSEPSQRERVFTAADALFEELGRASLPTVADVRKRACVDSNAATRLLREWRQERRKEVSDPAEEAPVELQASITAAVSSIWRSARRMSRQEFDTARAEWEAERKHTTAMLAEVSAGYDEKIAELRAAEERTSALQATIEGKEAQLHDLRDRIAVATEQLKSGKEQVLEVEKRVELLAAERDRAYEALRQARTDRAEEAAALQAGARDDLERKDAELEEVKQRCEVLRHETTAVQQQAHAAASEAATLREQLAIEQKRLASVLSDLLSTCRPGKEDAAGSKARRQLLEQRERPEDLAGEGLRLDFGSANSDES